MLQSFDHYTHFERVIKGLVGRNTNTFKQKASDFERAIADCPFNEVLEPHLEAEVLKEPTLDLFVAGQ